MAKKIKKGEFAGGGCAVQGIGFILLFLFPVGTVIGVGLLIAGSVMSVKTMCSNCGNPVDKTSKMCPHCKEQFQ